MFRNNNFAIEQFEAAITRGGNESLIAKMAMHNRGILSRLRDKTPIMTPSTRSRR